LAEIISTQAAKTAVKLTESLGGSRLEYVDCVHSNALAGCWNTVFCDVHLISISVGLALLYLETNLWGCV